MKFEELGIDDGKTLMLLPGTACTWQINFENVIDDLSKKYHLICVNYDGFDGNDRTVFPDMITETEKIEKYIIDNHGGSVEGVYGSSLGGSFAGLLIQRKKIHINHGFIGSSDLDQGGPFVAGIMSKFLRGYIDKASKSQQKKEKLYKSFEKGIGAELTEETRRFIHRFVDNMLSLNPESVTREFYSDYITPLDDGIDVPGTSIHVLYALKMGKKYEKRYLKHFKNPDIKRIDMQHEAWMYYHKWAPPVIEWIDECME